MLKMVTQLATASALMLSSASAFANWVVDSENSRVNFISVKNETVSENHHFAQLSGELNKEGEFSLTINLDSVQTNIAIRDERMRKFVFETSKFPEVKVSADTSELLKSLDGQTSAQGLVPTTYSLHGQEKTEQVIVRAVKMGNGGLMVSSVMPILVNPSEFGLTAGIDKLQELAGLSSITRTVPVSFVLTLHEQAE